MRATKFHDLIDVFWLRNPLHPGEKSFINQRHQDPIRHKTRAIVRWHWCFSHGFGQPQGGIQCGITGGQSADDFHQFHHRDRVEEMHPDNPVLSAGNRGGNFSNRDAGSVGGQDCILGKPCRKSAKWTSSSQDVRWRLQWQLPCRSIERIGILNPRCCSVGLGLSHPFFLDISGQSWHKGPGFAQAFANVV